ncbi:hypothetical protein PT974_08832 [Cladobotryum mycophilum]|uniref:Late endosomal/lysosomal adaptor and MAPK and MTOR activator 5 n=1 Tax=Cladobotryum mycophilum TaxID=491253 RepID=A0ABR0SEF3_9HYPO
MDASTLPRGSQQNTQKNNARDNSSTPPPPAYSPRSQLGSQLLAQLRQAQTARGQTTGDSSLILGRPPLTTVLDELDDDDTESQEGISPICLRINTSVVVSKNNNLVCLSDTPASHANAIARAVVQAIQENSSGQCGIPMIDEEGRPRPVKIEVDAGITVDGANNVVGSEDIINRVLSSRKHSRAHEDEEDDEREAVGTSSKRRCTGASSSQSC